MNAGDTDIDWPRLGRYLAGECTPSEAAAVDAWLAADPSRRALMVTLTAAWKTAGESRGHQQANVEAAWTKMSASIDAHESPVALRPRWHSRPMLRVAAVLVLTAGAVAVWQSTRATPPASATLQPREYATGAGQRDSITLNDGTTVLLGVASSLSVAGDYGRTSRNVSVAGEALFRVRHDATKQFRVSIGMRRVEDLGTEFTVRAYLTADTLRVLVLSGQVGLRYRDSRRNEAVVKAGQLGLYPLGGRVTVAPARNADALTAWTRGQLVFDHTPMRRVAEELERWYGVKVVLAGDAFDSRDVSVTFAGEKLDDVLKVIALSVNATVASEGGTVTFRTSGAQR